MDTTSALLINTLLVLGFGVQHSALATVRVKKVAQNRTGIGPLAWRSVESLANVVYILAAASLWQHTPDLVIWQLTGFPMYVMYTLLIGSWLWYWQLHLFEYDCGLAFGSTTLVAQMTGAQGAKLIPWKVGTRRWIRFPVHTAFFGMFFCLPTMTADLLVLAVVLNAYNVVGSVLYDLRLVHLAGEPYTRYMTVTGLIWPPIYRAPKGAVDIEMPSPRHWRRPSMHVSGLVVGVGLGLLYLALIGTNALTPTDMLVAGGAGLLGSVLVGLIIGQITRPQSDDWDQRQTDLSTTVALAAATGVVVWALSSWYLEGTPPSFAVFLPLWFTVQYLGHVFANLADRRKWSPAAPTDTVVADGSPESPVSGKTA